MRPCVSILVAALACQAGVSSAQSLAEVARREKERRRNLQTSTKVHTNTDAARSRTKRSEADSRTSNQTTSVRITADTVQVRAEPVRRVHASLDVTEADLVSETIVTPSRRESIALGYSLLESSRHREAAEEFRGVLNADPSNRDARIGLGRAYTRSGNHSAGRAEFEKILATDPAAADAMVGIAQSYQWSGVGPMAREWYEEALAVNPDLEAAEVGLGYIELWNEAAMAEQRSDDLLSRYPTSSSARSLQAEAEKARAPRAHVSLDRLTDTHNNELATTWVQGSLGLSSGWDIWLGGALYDMRFDGPPLAGAPGEGSITSVYSVMGRPVAPGQRVDFRVGVDYRKDTTNATEYVPIGGAAWSWGLDRKWSGRVSFNRDSFRYTTQALDDGIVLNAVAASVSNRFAANWLVDGEIGYWDIEDHLGIDNNRFNATAGVRYRRLFRGKIPFEAGYNFQYFTYKETFGASFFSPSFYRGHRLDVGISGPLGPLFDYSLRGVTGIQSFDEVSHEPLWTASGTFGVRLGSGYRLEAFGIRGDYLVLSNFPVTSEQFGVRIRWQGGGGR